MDDDLYSRSCLRPNYWKHKQHQPGALATSVKGSINELIACTHFLSLGYEVFRNVSPTGDGDIILWKRGTVPVVIDVKGRRVLDYVRKDGSINTSPSKPRSNCPGVITIWVDESGQVDCGDWVPNDHRF